MPRVRVIKVPVPADQMPPIERHSEPVSVNSLPDQHLADGKPVPMQQLSSPQEHTAQTQQSAPSRGVTFSKTALLLLVAGFIVAVLVAAAFIKLQSQNNTPTTNGSSGQSDVTQYQTELAKVIDLPSNITPTISTVDNAAQLAQKSPTLFKNAQNGDVLLVYLNPDKTGKVALYRPTTKKLILFIDGVDLGQASNIPN